MSAKSISEGDFRTIVDGTHALLAKVDNRGRFLYVNSAIARLVGRKPEEMLGRLYLRYVHPDDRDWVAHTFLRQVRTGQGVMGLEFRVIPVRDQVRWVRFVSTPILEGGQVVAHVATALDITDRVRLEEEREGLLEAEREQRILAETLAEVTLALTSQTSHTAVLDEILHQAQRVVAFDAGDISLLEGESLHTVRWLGYDRYGGEAIVSDAVRPLDALPYNQDAALGGRPIVVADTHQDALWMVLDETAWIKSALLIPLRVKNRTLGLMNLVSSRPGVFSERDAHRLQPFANAAAIALENARLFTATRRQAEQLEALYQVSQELATLRELDTLLYQIVERAMKLLDGEAAGIYLYRPERDLLEWAVAVGEGQAPVGTTLARGQGLSGRVWERGRPLIVSDYSDWSGRAEQWVPFPGMILGVPVQWRRQFLGVLNVRGRKGRRPFNEEDATLLSQFAVQAAIAIENARLVEGLEATVAARTAEIRAEKEKTETILRSVSDAIVLVDLERRIQYVNAAFTALTGYTEVEVLGRAADFLVDETVPERPGASLNRALALGEAWRGEATIRRKNGRTYLASLAIAPVRDADGELVGYVSSHDDISQRKELEQARSQFMTNVTHQLSTPVTNMQVYTRLLSQGKPEKAARYLQVLEEQADRLGHLVKDILEVTALDSGHAVQAWERVSVPSLLRDVMTRYDDQVREAHLQLELHPLPAELPPVRGDSGRLTQALGEVVENAIVFGGATGEGGVISIRVDSVQDNGDQWLTIAVHDTGPGISPQEQDQLFDRFYRGRLAESGHIPGTGLGLSVAQELLRAHGGRLSVESDGVPGHGSTFTLWLPEARD